MGHKHSIGLNLIDSVHDSACLVILMTGRGLLKLEDDVQTCGYEDVRVMWEMLRRSETEVVDKYHNHNKRKQHPCFGS